jgi:hypothetical protein
VQGRQHVELGVGEAELAQFGEYCLLEQAAYARDPLAQLQRRHEIRREVGLPGRHQGVDLVSGPFVTHGSTILLIHIAF